jgi:hypothetical protein
VNPPPNNRTLWRLAASNNLTGLVVFPATTTNGLLDAGESSAVTDPQGRYVLRGLTEGETYTGRVAGHSDFALTGPTGGDTTATANSVGPTFTGVPFLNPAPPFLAPGRRPTRTATGPSCWG